MVHKEIVHVLVIRLPELLQRQGKQLDLDKPGHGNHLYLGIKFNCQFKISCGR